MLTQGAPSSRNETIANIDPLQPATGAENQGNAAIISADGWKLQLGMTGPPWAWSPPNSSAPGGGGAPPVNCSAAFAAGVCLPGNDLKNVTNPVDSAHPAACCARCASTAGCGAWTWNAGRCYVKLAGGAPAQGANCTSSPPGGRPAPPPVWPLQNGTLQLFHVAEDPWERVDVAAQYPGVVARLLARLAQWGAGARTPYYWGAQVDPASDPARRNGTWTPWLV